eukprot:SAG22_NODE_558_length_9115_cov_15.267524_2_plen_1348_part_00
MLMGGGGRLDGPLAPAVVVAVAVAVLTLQFGTGARAQEACDEEAYCSDRRASQAWEMGRMCGTCAEGTCQQLAVQSQLSRHTRCHAAGVEGPGRCRDSLSDDSMTSGYFSCECREGFSGVLCDFDADECAAEPCQNGAVCTESCSGCRSDIQAESCLDSCVTDAVEPGAFHCECTTGYEGDQCEDDADECAARPCVQGVCVESHTDGDVPLGEFRCDCYAGWGGSTCACSQGYVETNSGGAAACNIVGCTDSLAANYDPVAAVDGGGCAYDCVSLLYGLVATQRIVFSEAPTCQLVAEDDRCTQDAVASGQYPSLADAGVACAVELTAAAVIQGRPLAGLEYDGWHGGLLSDENLVTLDRRHISYNAGTLVMRYLRIGAQSSSRYPGTSGDASHLIVEGSPVFIERCAFVSTTHADTPSVFYLSGWSTTPRCTDDKVTDLIAWRSNIEGSYFSGTSRSSDGNPGSFVRAFNTSVWVTASTFVLDESSVGDAVFFAVAWSGTVVSSSCRFSSRGATITDIDRALGQSAGAYIPSCQNVAVAFDNQFGLGIAASTRAEHDSILESCFGVTNVGWSSNCPNQVCGAGACSYAQPGVHCDCADTSYRNAAYEFTHLGATGAVGPTSTSSYAGTPLEGVVWLEEGIQRWNVPVTGRYKVAATGAAGGASNGNNGKVGALIIGEFQLTAGETLKILVGQMGLRASETQCGGGGGTFVTTDNDDILVVAGGAACYGAVGYPEAAAGAAHGQSTECGGQSQSTPVACDGQGGGRGCGSGGAGFYTNAAMGGGSTCTLSGQSDTSTHLAKSFLSGGAGGAGEMYDGRYGWGGFGGGGGGGNEGMGGGGGYSGGGAGGANHGSSGGSNGSGGGGSKNNGLNQVNIQGGAGNADDNCEESQTHGSCAEVLAQNPSAASGTYTIQSNGTLVDVHCDMTTDGGGWTRCLSQTMVSGGVNRLTIGMDLSQQRTDAPLPPLEWIAAACPIPSGAEMLISGHDGGQRDILLRTASQEGMFGATEGYTCYKAQDLLAPGVERNLAIIRHGTNIGPICGIGGNSTRSIWADSDGNSGDTRLEYTFHGDDHYRRIGTVDNAAVGPRGIELYFRGAAPVNCTMGHDVGTAAESCAAILHACPGVSDGSYWLDSTQFDGGQHQSHCDMTTAGGGWSLVMVNGKGGQHKDALRLGTNVDGVGTVSSWSDDGAHKMAEALFDSFGFTEVLAIGSDGRWVRIEKTDGSAMQSADLFAVDGCSDPITVHTDNGTSQQYDAFAAGGSRCGGNTVGVRNHGPFCGDPFGLVYGWMWTDYHGVGAGLRLELVRPQRRGLLIRGEPAAQPHSQRERQPQPRHHDPRRAGPDRPGLR